MKTPCCVKELNRIPFIALIQGTMRQKHLYYEHTYDIFGNIPISQHGVFVLCAEFPLLEPGYNPLEYCRKRVGVIHHFLPNKTYIIPSISPLWSNRFQRNASLFTS